MTTANEYHRYVIIRYRIAKPKHTTWSRLLDIGLRLRERAVKQLKLQIDMMLQDDAVTQDIRKHLQVSHRHSLSRRDVFNYIVKLHNENEWAFNWRLILYVLPIHKHIIVRIDCGAITCDWFRTQCEHDSFDKLEAMHVAQIDMDSAEVLYDLIDGYTLPIIDNIEEYAQLCV